MNDIRYNLFKWGVLLLFLQSMFIWFLWDQQILFIIICLFLTLIFFYNRKQSVFSIKRANIIPVLLILVIQIYVVRDQNINGLILALIKTILISSFIILNDKIKIYLFRFLTKSIAVIMAISVFAWILYLLDVPLPYFEISFNENQYTFDNYYFFLHNHIDMLLPYPRFSSVFLEPGQLGMILSFLLLSNRFELKRKEILIIFISLLFTFSLAAYVMLFISATVYLISLSKKPFRNFIIWGSFLFLIYSFSNNYKNGENLVNLFVFERLQIDNGKLAGDNRNSEDLDVYFKKFVNSADFSTGLGKEKYIELYLGSNAGYKVFILQYGIIGTFLVLLFYLFIVLGKSTKMAWILFLVYILCFIQAAYPLWDCQLILFITAIPFFKSHNLKIKYINKKIFNLKPNNE